MKAQSNLFLNNVLDCMNDQIAVVDDSFRIVFVNDAWNKFACENGYSYEFNWIGSSYIEPCELAVHQGDEYAIRVLSAIEKLRLSTIEEFRLEYPCNSPTQERWFQLMITPFHYDNNRFFVITHRETTERVLLEFETQRLARLDPLTGIANRRAFEEFYIKEWNRCRRSNMPISLALIDLDSFKYVNDQWGHPVGDQALIKVAQTLNGFTERASDVCARYGGDEFIAVWGGMDEKSAQALAVRILRELKSLSLDFGETIERNQISCSIGLYTTSINDNGPEEAVSIADNLMYQAKQKGGNQIASGAHI